ncbi:MAG: tRNA uridine-5-carboxymethylaminomethyl(34) synthesis GTPase MnmE [Candidatus Babeliales bacterium]
MALFHAKDQETIIAQCTPQGSGALALIRLSGNTAFEVADQLCKLASNIKLSEVPSHTVHYGSVVEHTGAIIDRVMIIAMRGPKTFTGQDTVEITCHNNQFVIEQIIERAIACGARLATGGEFSKRSVLNNKMDLVQAEAVHELIHAAHQQSLKQSLSQLEGSFSRWIITLEKRLVKCLALSEASFEFLDEENMAFGGQIREMLSATLRDITTIKKTFDQQQQIRDGIRIALLGSVNVGKSSLFNALLEKERAIVTDIAGTTRDVIEASMSVDGGFWTFVDTAGLRTTNDIVELKGIERSHEEAAKADIILLIYDGARELLESERVVYQSILREYGSKVVVVQNKSDQFFSPLIPSESRSDLYRGTADKKDFQKLLILKTSVNLPETIIQLHQVIKNKVATLFASSASPFLLNKRQFQLLVQLEQTINTIMPMLDGAVEYELLSCHVQDALSNLSELSGKSISEAGMDAVFKEFCVGK